MLHQTTKSKFSLSVEKFRNVRLIFAELEANFVFSSRVSVAPAKVTTGLLTRPRSSCSKRAHFVDARVDLGEFLSKKLSSDHYFSRRKCQALKPYSMLPGGGFAPYGVDMFPGAVPGSGLPSPAAYANSHASQFSVSQLLPVHRFIQQNTANNLFRISTVNFNSNQETWAE